MIFVLVIIIGIVVGLAIRVSLNHSADDEWNGAVWEGHEMIVRGTTREALTKRAEHLGLVLVNVRVMSHGAYAFRLAPESSKARYARHAPSGRKGPWTCYHGFRYFCLGMFSEGITSLNTVGPMGRRKTYHNQVEFMRDLVAFGDRRMGSNVNPVSFIDLCSHEEEGYRAL